MWKFKVELLLQRDKLWSTVIQEPPLPITDDWTLKDQAAKATICLSMEDKFLINVRTCTTAKNTWDTLKTIYEHPSLSGKLHLMRRLYSTKYEQHASMRDFVNSILELVGQLSNLGEITKDKNIIAILLCGLPTDYNGLITAIESKDEEELTLDYVKIKLYEEAARREKDIHINPIESLAMPSLRYNPIHSRPITCFNCGQPGHTKRDCQKDIHRNDYGRWRNPQYEKKYSTQKEHSTFVSNQLQPTVMLDQMDSDEETMPINNRNPNCQCEKTTEQQYTALSGILDDNSETNGWILDSGATAHMTPYKDFFQEINYLKDKIPIKLANGNLVYAEGEGSGLLSINNDIRSNDIVQISSVLFVPSLKFQLLSIKQLCSKGHDVKFKNNECHIYNQGKIIASAHLQNGIFILKENSNTNNLVLNSCIHKWHNRLGHKSNQMINNMHKNKSAVKLKINKCDHTDFCRSCNLGKMKQKSFKISENVIPHAFHTIVTDVCGPIQTASIGGNNYILTITDFFSRYICTILMKHKSQTTNEIIQYLERGHNKFGYYPVVLRSDGGGEYVNHELDRFLDIKGITHQVVVPYSPQQNGGAERVNSTLLNMCRCMLKQYSLPLKLWGEAITTAAYIINRTVHSSTKKTPYEMWNGKAPDLSRMKTFGCKAYAFKPKILRKKLDDTSTEGVFVGHGINTKGYRLWMPGTNTVITTTKMTFDESPYNYQQYFNMTLNECPNGYIIMPHDPNRETQMNEGRTVRRSARENKGVPPVKLTY